MNCKNYFGIDKATIGGFEIMSIDNEKLSKIKNVTSFRGPAPREAFYSHKK